MHWDRNKIGHSEYLNLCSIPDSSCLPKPFSSHTLLGMFCIHSFVSNFSIQYSWDESQVSFVKLKKYGQQLEKTVWDAHFYSSFFPEKTKINEQRIKQKQLGR